MTRHLDDWIAALAAARGRITAEKSGHSVHAQLMSKLLKTGSAWAIE